MTRTEATELAELIAGLGGINARAKPARRGGGWVIVTREPCQPPRTFKNRVAAFETFLGVLEGSLNPVRFSFADGERFNGFADGTRWNGFDNVRVTPETLAAIKASMPESDDFDGLTPDEIGLIDLSNGFATVADWPDD